jgi:hypothetical protein
MLHEPASASRSMLDAPPVLGIADALVLGNQVGSVLFVVAAGARKAHAKAALSASDRPGCRSAR